LFKLFFDFFSERIVIIVTFLLNFRHFGLNFGSKLLINRVLIEKGVAASRLFLGSAPPLNFKQLSKTFRSSRS
jgi:hypothetical protein